MALANPGLMCLQPVVSTATVLLAGNTVDNSSDQKLTQIIDLLQPVSRMAVDRLAQSCAASNISAEDLQKVRDILNYVVLPAPENEDSEPVILHEDFW